MIQNVEFSKYLMCTKNASCRLVVVVVSRSNSPWHIVELGQYSSRFKPSGEDAPQDAPYYILTNFCRVEPGLSMI